MLISISAINAGDFLFLDTNTAPAREGSRRLSRTATLDGSAVITDGGVTDADRGFDFTTTQVPEDIREALWAMFQREDLVHLSCPEGVFAGYLQRVKITASDVKISFMICEKLT
ncbi:MAG: hypothetical protein Q7U40_15410 [Desulfatirhabdiaceae bacterium]|nr:hypothetical protein [Desulfatirhabdiaceae bacterium]